MSEISSCTWRNTVSQLEAGGRSGWTDVREDLALFEVAEFGEQPLEGELDLQVIKFRWLAHTTDSRGGQRCPCAYLFHGLE